MDCPQTWINNTLDKTFLETKLKLTLSFIWHLFNLDKIAITLSILGQKNMTHSTFLFVWHLFKCDLEFYKPLTVQGKLLISAKILITVLVIDRFDWYLDKITLMTKPTFLQNLISSSIDLYMTLTGNNKKVERDPRMQWLLFLGTAVQIYSCPSLGKRSYIYHNFIHFGKSYTRCTVGGNKT